MLSRLKQWWEGTPIDNTSGDTLVFIGDFRRLHWTALACRALVGYASKNHRWLIGTVIAVVGIIIAAQR
jgi:hypothetical protein